MSEDRSCDEREPGEGSEDGGQWESIWSINEAMVGRADAVTRGRRENLEVRPAVARCQITGCVGGLGGQQLTRARGPLGDTRRVGNHALSLLSPAKLPRQRQTAVDWKLAGGAGGIPLAITWYHFLAYVNLPFQLFSGSLLANGYTADQAWLPAWTWHSCIRLAQFYVDLSGHRPRSEDVCPRNPMNHFCEKRLARLPNLQRFPSRSRERWGQRSTLPSLPASEEPSRQSCASRPNKLNWRAARGNLRF